MSNTQALSNTSSQRKTKSNAGASQTINASETIPPPTGEQPKLTPDSKPPSENQLPSGLKIPQGADKSSNIPELSTVPIATGPLTVTQEVTRRAQYFHIADSRRMKLSDVPYLMVSLGCLISQSDVEEFLANIPEKKMDGVFVRLNTVCKMLAIRIKSERMYEPPPAEVMINLVEKLNVSGDAEIPWTLLSQLIKKNFAHISGEDLHICEQELVDYNGQVKLCCFLKKLLPSPSKFSIYKYMDDIEGVVAEGPGEDEMSNDEISNEEGESNDSD